MSAALVLASASPRRRELLARLGIAFDVLASEVPETPRSGESGGAFACRVARAKAVAVAQRCPGRPVLGADTVVVVDEEIFGKPLDRADARHMLQVLSGRRHRVLTAVSLVSAAGTQEVLVETAIEFRPLMTSEIEEYLDTAEPYDKAGAYAIQGAARRFVVRIDGSYSNVIGLPLDEVATLLQRHLCTGTDQHP